MVTTVQHTTHLRLTTRAALGRRDGAGTRRVPDTAPPATPPPASAPAPSPPSKPAPAPAPKAAAPAPEFPTSPPAPSSIEQMPVEASTSPPPPSDTSSVSITSQERRHSPPFLLDYHPQTPPPLRPQAPSVCYYACAVLLLLIALAAAFVGAVYLVYRPRAPAFSVASLSIHGLNATSLTLSASLAPQLDAVVRADNARKKKVGIEYRRGGEVAVSYDSGTARLAEGAWPAFRQPPRNVTAFKVSMAGEGVRLTEEQAKRIAAEQAAGAVPLQVEATLHVRLRFGGVLRTWTVDRLESDAVVVNRGCKVKVRPLWWWWPLCAIVALCTDLVDRLLLSIFYWTRRDIKRTRGKCNVMLAGYAIMVGSLILCPLTAHNLFNYTKQGIYI